MADPDSPDELPPAKRHTGEHTLAGCCSPRLPLAIPASPGNTITSLSFAQVGDLVKMLASTELVSIPEYALASLMMTCSITSSKPSLSVVGWAIKTHIFQNRNNNTPTSLSRHLSNTVALSGLALQRLVEYHTSTCQLLEDLRQSHPQLDPSTTMTIFEVDRKPAHFTLFKFLPPTIRNKIWLSVMNFEEIIQVGPIEPTEDVERSFRIFTLSKRSLLRYVCGESKAIIDRVPFGPFCYADSTKKSIINRDNDIFWFPMCRFTTDQIKYLQHTKLGYKRVAMPFRRWSNLNMRIYKELAVQEFAEMIFFTRTFRIPCLPVVAIFDGVPEPEPIEWYNEFGVGKRPFKLKSRLSWTYLAGYMTRRLRGRQLEELPAQNLLHPKITLSGIRLEIDSLFSGMPPVIATKEIPI